MSPIRRLRALCRLEARSRETRDIVSILLNTIRRKFRSTVLLMASGYGLAGGVLVLSMRTTPLSALSLYITTSER